MTGGFRGYRVVRKVRESSVITSFYLQPEQPGACRFVPGQFLTLALSGVRRNYSLSGPQADDFYRITVKREPAAPSQGPGLASAFLHDRVAEGDVVQAQGPRGDFVLNRDSTRPVLLISGGVGLTPMVAMLHDLVPGDRRVLFLHACENGQMHALRDEVLDLAARRSGIGVHFCYRNPSAADRAEGRMHSEGVITRALLQSLLCLDDYEAYLCGPPPFMQALYAMLRGLGLAEDRIAYEFFGPATVLKAAPAAPPPPPALPMAEGTIQPGRALISFRRSGRAAVWDPGAGSLLAFAEDQGLRPEFSCRAGVCGSCAAGLIAGDVAYFEDPLDEVAAGRVLLCCARPLGNVVLDL